MALLATILLFAITHVLQASLSFWWDEAFTVETFVSSPIQAWTMEYHSNNHALFTFLSAAAADLLGPSEISYRLPSFGMAIAACAVLIAHARSHIGRAEALGIAAILLGSPLLLFWLPQARGYGLAVFASVLVLIGALKLASARDFRDRIAWMQLLLGGFIGISTLPHFAVPFTLTCATLAVLRRIHWRSIGLAWISVGAATAAFYLPSGLSRMASATGGSFGPRLTYLDLIRGPFRFQIIGTLSDAGELSQLVSSTWVPVVVTALVVVLIMALVRAYRDADWAPLLLALIPVYGTYAAAVGIGLAVTDRTLLFLMPQMSLMFALGIGYITRRRNEHAALLWLRRVPLLGALTLVTLLSLQLALDWHSSPIESYREAATVAAQSGISNVITDSARSLGFSHYLPDVIVLNEESLIQALCETPDSYAYIEHSYDREFSPPLECLHEREATEIEFLQRRRGSMSVWIVPESDSLE